jgi:hypothetical protein
MVLNAKGVFDLFLTLLIFFSTSQHSTIGISSMMMGGSRKVLGFSLMIVGLIVGIVFCMIVGVIVFIGSFCFILSFGVISGMLRFELFTLLDGISNGFSLEKRSVDSMTKSRKPLIHLLLLPALALLIQNTVFGDLHFGFLSL